MEQSFFSRIQNYFDASFAGRYEAAILLEVGKECPDIIKSLFKEYKSKQHQINLEYGYQPNRYADLAICDKKTGLPVFLLEIKKEDKSLDGQLEDYADYVKKHQNVKFLYLTKHIPPNADMQKLPKNKRTKHLLFSDFLNSLLEKEKVRNNPYGKSYIQFLKESGNMYEKIDPTTIRQLLVRLFLQNGDTGEGRFMSKKKLLVDFPDTFHHLFNNMTLLNEEIRPLLGENKFTVDFFIDPEIENGKKSITKKGGDFYVYAYGLITKKNKKEYAYIEYGIQLSIERSEKENKPTCYLYGKTSFFGSNHTKKKREERSEEERLYKAKKIELSSISNKKTILKKLKELLMDVLEESLEIATMDSVRNNFEKIRVNLKINQ